jgi:acetyl-CoA acetyltransferase
MARVKLVKIRIRGGKVERRKKVSNVEGMKISDGKLKRMSAAERRRRKLGAKKSARKRKIKMAQILRKRKRSLQKRERLT